MDIMDAGTLPSMAAFEAHRILVFGREHLGDAVNVTGPLLGLRSLYPRAHIALEVGPRGSELFQRHPGVDEVIPRVRGAGLRGKIRRLVRLRSGRFDMAVAFDDGSKHVLDATLAGIRTRVGIWRGKRHRRLYSLFVEFRVDEHEVRDQCQRLLQALGASDDWRAPRLFLDEEVHKIANEHPQFEVAIHPGAAEPRRRAPASVLMQVHRSLQAQGVRSGIVGGTRDGDVLAPFADLDDEGALLQFADPNPCVLAAWLARTGTLICMDSGPMHLSAAVGTPVVALYGFSDPVHTGPYGQGHHIIRGSCPCPVRLASTCNGQCLRDLEADEIVSAALNTLERRWI